MNSKETNILGLPVAVMVIVIVPTAPLRATLVIDPPTSFSNSKILNILEASAVFVKDAL